MSTDLPLVINQNFSPTLLSVLQKRFEKPPLLRYFSLDVEGLRSALLKEPPLFHHRMCGRADIPNITEGRTVSRRWQRAAFHTTL